MRYSSIESEYIKRKLADTSWERRQDIDDLISLHHFIRNGCSGYISAMHFEHLKHAYHEQYLALLQEFSPDTYAAALATEEAQRKELEDLKRDQEEREKLLLADWLKAGGRP